MAHETFNPEQNIHRDKNRVPVRSYIDNLRAQVYEVFKKYDVANMTEFIAKMKKVEVSDRQQVINLMKAIEKAYKNNETFEESNILEKIQAREKESLEKFFGKPIDVPPVPEEVTTEKLRDWEVMGLELHYLPPENMAENDNAPGWTEKPAYKAVKRTGVVINNEILQLQGGWILVDAHQKPDGGDDLYYKNDEKFLRPILWDLNWRGVIRQLDERGEPLSSTTRVGISSEELEQPEVMQAIAEKLRVKAEQVTLPKAIEFNVVGNLYHPEWGETLNYEWTSDKLRGGSTRFWVGSSSIGGLRSVLVYSRKATSQKCGFRIFVRLS